MCEPGDARFDAVPGHVGSNSLVVVGVVLDRVWARPDQRHFAGEHVEQLRQLVDAVPAKEPADARDARIVLDLEARALNVVYSFSRSSHVWDKMTI